MHRDDLSKVAPLWLSVTEDVREDPEVSHPPSDPGLAPSEQFSDRVVEHLR